MPRTAHPDRPARTARTARTAVATVVVLATAVATAGTAAAAPKPPATTTPTYKALTYVGWGTGYDLYTMNADGTGQTLLPKATKNSDTTHTNTPATEWAPAYAPGGGLIAFQSSRGGDPDVWVQNTVTGAMTRVTSSTRREAPVGWYTDAAGGLRVVYDADTQLYSARPDGTDAFAITLPVTVLSRVAVSANGVLAIAADRGDGIVRIYTTPIDRSAPSSPSAWSPVTTPPAGGKDASPTWLPDGGLLFARGNAVMRLAPGTVESATTPAQTVLAQGVSVANPAYSAATGQLAYAVNSTTSNTDGWQIAVTTIGTDWTAPAGRTLTPASSNTSQPTWKS